MILKNTLFIVPFPYFPQLRCCLPRQCRAKAASACHCSNLRNLKRIFGKHRRVTQGGWFFCLMLASDFRRWYLSVPELGHQKAASCPEPSCAHSLHPGSKKCISLGSAQNHTALFLPGLKQRLCPKAIFCNSTMWMWMLDRFLLQTASSADCSEMSSRQDGRKAFSTLLWTWGR